MRFWLSRSFGRGSGTSSATAAAGRSSGRTMGIESLEHTMRSKVRMFLRHTWLVTIIGTIICSALPSGRASTYTTEGDHMRIAAGPRDAKFVQGTVRSAHQATPQSSSAARSDRWRQGERGGDEQERQADLAILPSNLDDSLNWPVVAILRQNVMALIVPARRQESRSGKKGKKTPRSKKWSNSPAIASAS